MWRAGRTVANQSDLGTIRPRPERVKQSLDVAVAIGEGDTGGVAAVDPRHVVGHQHVAVADIAIEGECLRHVHVALVGEGLHEVELAADTVTVNGSSENDTINITASGSLVTVSGLSAQVTIDHAESGDNLMIIGGAGNDTIDASAFPAGSIGLTINGGLGNDTFVFTFGTNGHDVVQGFEAHGVGTLGDVVALVGSPDHTFDQAVADGHIAQSGGNVVISDGTNVAATLQDISLAALHANDFLFS